MARRTYTGDSFGYQTRAPVVAPASAPPRVNQGTSSSSNIDSSNGVFTASLPSSQVGSVVPAIIGKVLIRNPNIIFTGQINPIYSEKTEVSETSEIVGGVTTTTTTTTKTRFVVGYKIAMQLALCLGPNVRLRSIVSGETPLWFGNLGHNETAVIATANSFLTGATVRFHDGRFDQTPDMTISGVTDVPGYVGTAYVTLTNVRADVSMGDIGFEVERYPNPLELDDEVNRIFNDFTDTFSDDINIMTAIVEAITNNWGFGGLDISNINVDSFIDAAEILIAEGNVSSVALLNLTSVSGLIADLQEQAGAFVFQHPETGLIDVRLIRPETINKVVAPRFNVNRAQFQSWNKVVWPSTIEQLSGVYTSRAKAYVDSNVFTQNTANLSLAGRGKRSTSISYPHVYVEALASKLLARDMSILSAPIFSCSFVADRTAATIVPGTIVVITSEDYGLLNVPVLVMKVRKSPIDQNNVVLYVRQVIFSSQAEIFGAPGVGYDPSSDTGAHTPSDVVILDAPYFIARSAQALNSIKTTPISYPLILAKPFNDIQFSFTAVIENAPGAAENTSMIYDGVYATFGNLQSAIDKYDDFADGIIASVVIDGVINDSNMYDITLAGVQQGRLFMFIGNEIFSFEGCSQTGGDEWTLTNVHRALLDTVPVTHAADDDVYIIGNLYTNVPYTSFPYPPTFTPEWLFTGNTTTERGNIIDALSTNAWLPSDVRLLAPPRPHNTKINTVRSSAPAALTVGLTSTISWSTRSRIGASVKTQLDAAEPGEIFAGDYQVHRVFIIDSAAVLWDCGATADSGNDNDLVITVPALAALGAGWLYVQAETTIGATTYTSLQQDRLPVVLS